MKKNLLTIVMIVAMVPPLFSQERSEGCSTNGKAKFAPEDGKKLLIMGQDLGAVGGLDAPHDNGYVDNFEGVPAGVTSYTNLNNLSGLQTLTNYGAGDVFAGAYLEDETFANTFIVLGLYLVNQLNAINNGDLDTEIASLAQWIKDTERPVFLRVGYEFDLQANHYDPGDYQDAWKHIVAVFDEEEVHNVDFVFQSTGNNQSRPEAYYPGDEYVDWVGYSYFNYVSDHGAEMISFARAHNKPVMIAEAAPRKDLKTIDGQTVWENWYEPFFSQIENHTAIKAVAYINTNWDVQPMWKNHGWGDSRIQVNSFVQQKWEEKVYGTNQFVLASDTLFNYLSYPRAITEECYTEAPLAIAEEYSGSTVKLFNDRNHVVVHQNDLLWIKQLVIYDTRGQIVEKINVGKRYGGSFKTPFHNKGLFLVVAELNNGKLLVEKLFFK